jgi:hypothetical protein
MFSLLSLTGHQLLSSLSLSDWSTTVKLFCFLSRWPLAVIFIRSLATNCSP